MCRPQGPHLHWSLRKFLPTCSSLPLHSQGKCCCHCYFLQEVLLPFLLSYHISASYTDLTPTTPYSRLEWVMHLTSPQVYKLLKSKDHIWLIPVCSPQGMAKQQVLKYGMNDHRVFLLKNNLGRDFPGGPVVKNPPCNARDTGLILGQGSKILHSLGQRSLQTETTEPACHN